MGKFPGFSRNWALQVPLVSQPPLPSRPQFISVLKPSAMDVALALFPATLLYCAKGNWGTKQCVGELQKPSTGLTKRPGRLKLHTHSIPKLLGIPRSLASTSNHAPEATPSTWPSARRTRPRARARLYKSLGSLESRSLKANPPGNPGSPLPRAPTNQPPPLAPTSKPSGPRLLGTPRQSAQTRGGTHRPRGCCNPPPQTRPPEVPAYPRHRREVTSCGTPWKRGRAVRGGAPGNWRAWEPGGGPVLLAPPAYVGWRPARLGSYPHPGPDAWGTTLFLEDLVTSSRFPLAPLC